MRTTFLLLATTLLLAGCATPEQQEAHRIFCEQSGFPVGTPAFNACVEREDNSYLPPLLRPAPATPAAPTPLV